MYEYSGGPITTEIKPSEEAKRVSETTDSSSSSSYKLDSAMANMNTKLLFSSSESRETLSSSGDPSAGKGEEEEWKVKRRRVIKRRVVYPFAVVKPGGSEEDVTLNDINERILMPPTRPVRHPVGDFACRPCVSAQGPGLSGKAVVALTKIHTQGRGTITIIRTKG